MLQLHSRREFCEEGNVLGIESEYRPEVPVVSAQLCEVMALRQEQASKQVFRWLGEWPATA
jgi:hypothetical protein